MDQQTTISTPIAPEDVAVGCYVAVLHVIGQHMPFFCEGDFFDRRTEPAKMRWLPSPGSPPMKVLDVCLPFVLARQPDGEVRTLDTRRHRLARLSDSYGRRAFRAFKAREKEKERKGKEKCKKDEKSSSSTDGTDDKKE